MDTDIDGVTVPDTPATKKRKAKVAKRSKPKAKKTKPKAKRKPAKKVKAKRPKAAKSKAKKSKPKKTAKRKPAKKKTRKGVKPLVRTERIDMRVTKAQKARVYAKAKRLKRTYTSVVLEAIDSVR